MAARRTTLQVHLTGTSTDLQKAFRDAQQSADKLGANLKIVQKEAKATAKSLNDSDRAVNDYSKSFHGFNKALGSGLLQTRALREAIGALKFPTAIAAFGVLTEGASAAAGGVTALVGALAPLGGALAAYPALASTAAQGIGVFKLATSNIFAAVGGLNERLNESTKAFKDLSPEAQRVARRLDDMKKPLRDLSKVSQREMFPGLERGIMAAQKNLPVLRRIVRDTAGELGGLGERFGRFLGSNRFGRDLERQGQRNVRWMHDLGRAALSLAKAVEDVTISAGPLVNWMVRGVREGARWVQVQVRAGRESGKLAKFFNETRVAMSRVVRIGGDLAEAFWNITRAGKPLGDDILVNLVKAADQFKDWTASARGRNAIREYFERIRPSVMELGRLVRDAVKAFARMGSGSELAPLLRALRTRFLPAIESVTTSTTAAFGPPVIEALSQMADLFGHLAGSSGPLVTFVKLLTEGLKVLNSLLDSVPGLNEAMVALAGAGSIVKILGIAEAVTGIGTLRRGLRGAATEAKAVQVGGAGIPALTAGSPLGGAARPTVRGAFSAARATGGIGAGLRGAAGVAARGAGGLAMGALGGPAGLALSAGLIFGPALISALRGPQKTVNQMFDETDRKARKVAGGSLPKYASELRKSAREAKRFGDDGKQVAKALEDQANRISRAFGNEWIGAIRKNWKDLRTSGTTSVQALQSNVDRNTQLIRDRLGTNTKEGRRAAVANFNEMTRVIKARMKDGSLSTETATRLINKNLVNTSRGRKAAAESFRLIAAAARNRMSEAERKTDEGTQKINALLERALVALGLSGAQAHAKVTTGTTNTRTNLGGGTAGNTGDRFRAAGGWIGGRGQRGRDAVPAMLGVGEAVLNRHQQAVVEGLLGRGFLDKLFAHVRTPHYAARGGYVPQPAMAFAAGGRIPAVNVNMYGGVGAVAQRAVDVDRREAERILERQTIAAISTGGAGSTTGLAPQVRRALAWARAHGWRGTVSSGFRSRAKQQFLWDNRASNPNPVAPPGTSMHERGLAVDVTDPAGFAAAMANAPPGARLIWFGPGDPPHFSTTGHTRGGFAHRFAKGGRAGVIFDFFRGQGFTRAQAAAFVGNFTQESGLNPAAVEPGGAGRGLAQWGGSRFAALQRFARHRGKPWTDLESQLRFVMFELRGKESAAGRAIAQTRGRGVGAAVRAIGHDYERFSVQGNRLGPARAILERFAKRDAPSGGGGGGGGGGNLDLPTRLDALTAHVDLAALTRGTRDDRRAAQRLVAFYRQRLRRARRGGDPRRISEAAQGLGSARSSLRELTPRRRPFVPVNEALARAYEPTLDYAAAVAEGTPDTADDEAIRKQRLAIAEMRFNNTATSLMGVMSPARRRRLLTRAAAQRRAINELSQPVDGGEADLAQALADNTAAQKELKDEMKRRTDFTMQLLGTQGGQILAGIADMVSGQIGGAVGLGAQTPSFPGGRLRY